MDKLASALAFLNLIFLAIVLGALLALPGCAHNPPPRGTKLVQRVCPAAEILTFSFEDWSNDDQAAFETATRRCSELYPRSPCLKKFYRYAQLRYGVICGHSPDQEVGLVVSP